MGAAALASGVLAVTQIRSASDLKAQIARLSSESKEHQDALRKLQAEKQAGDDSLALLQENNDRLKRERDEAKDKIKQLLADAEAGKKNDSGAAAGAAAANPKAFDLRGMFQGFAKQMDDPEMRKMMRQNQERMVTAAYEALFKKLGLSEQDSKLVADLIAERNFTALDKGRKVLDGGSADDASAAAIRKDIEATKADYDSKLKSVLGEEKFKDLTAYEQTVGDQRALDFFDRNFKSKNQPLAPEQKEALVSIMRDERMRSPTNEIPDLGGGPGMAILMSDADLKAREQRDEAYNQRVLSRASEAGLSPDQVIILQDSFKQRNEWRAFGARMGRAFVRPE
jgi:hypothetical protein